MRQCRQLVSSVVHLDKTINSSGTDEASSVSVAHTGRSWVVKHRSHVPEDTLIVIIAPLRNTLVTSAVDWQQ